MSVPPLLLLATPDDYLLELERVGAEAAWRAAHSEGESISFDEAPPPARLLAELANRSLFAPARLLVVRDARPYLGGRGAGDEAVAMLAATLATIPLDEVALLLAAASEEKPKGALAEVVAVRGEVRFLPLPPVPKPWEDVRVTREQRAVLEGVIRRVAPAVLDHPDAAQALCEAYGFRPRELAQAARGLTLSGVITSEAVRELSGAGEGSFRELEEALLGRDPAAMARFFGRLSVGGQLLGWRGEVVEPERLGAALAGTLGRLLRQALAVRGHAHRAGIADELDPRRCAARFWYKNTFKDGLFPRLAEDVEAVGDSPVAGMSAWAMHRVFRVAAAYRDEELLDALARLAGGGAERSKAPQALAALSAVALRLVNR